MPEGSKYPCGWTAAEGCAGSQRRGAGATTCAGEASPANVAPPSALDAAVIELYQHGLPGREFPGSQLGARGSWYSLWTSAWIVPPTRYGAWTHSWFS